MTQNWFDGKYSKEKEVINLVNNSIEGPLKIEGFERLKSISLKNLKLTSLEISNCSQLTELDLELSKLTNLSVSDCPGLTKLDFSQCKLTQLTELEVSNLIELDCSNTSIERLSLNLCPNITQLNCSNINKLIYLDISNCSKLEFLDCTNNGLTSLDLSNCPKIKNKDLPSNLEVIREKEIRNILIVGHTGGGKSTLANVLSGTDDFEESEKTVRDTKNFQEKIFELNGIEYRVVVIRIRLVEMKTLHNKIGEIIYSMPEGISQVLFVVDEGFTVREIKMFEIFEQDIFESDIVEYITIVRTKFSNFKDEEECKKDKKYFCGESEKVANLVNKCSVVYVNNPPTNTHINDDDDDTTVEINRKLRVRSRTILLNHLETVCRGNYKLKTWDKLYGEVTDYIKSVAVGEKSQTVGNLIKEIEHDLNLEVPTLARLAGSNYTWEIDNLTNMTSRHNMEKEKFRNLLMIGRTGGGRSALSNVLTGTDEFQESASSVSVTKNFQKKVFDYNGIKYRVVDTIGVGDTKLTKRKVLYRIAEGIYSMPGGLSQVLFVIDGRLTEEEINVLKLFENSIFNGENDGDNKDDILNYCTIVRTKFSNFKNEEECKKERKRLLGESEAISKLVESCNVVCIDNPPTNTIINDDDDRDIIENNKGIRKKSREILLNYLERVCQEKYKLKPWNELHAKIDDYVNNNPDTEDLEIKSPGCSFL